jgi:hypothetical protein
MLSVKARKVNLSKDTVIRVLGKDAQFYFMFLPMAHNFIQCALVERSVSFSIVQECGHTVLFIGRLLGPSKRHYAEKN